MNMRRGIFARAAGLAALAIALAVAGNADAQSARKKSPAPAESTLITGSSFDAILGSIERAGLHAEMTTASDGDPLIQSTDDDAPFLVHFYGCTGGQDCQYIQFTSGWDLIDGATLDVIEKWNEDRVWGRAFLDSDDDPWIDMTVNLKGGVTAENFDDTVSWWWSVMRDFEKAIGFQP